jgi:hypothetical protein
MKQKLVTLSLVAAFIVFAFVTPVVENLWHLATGTGFAIPKESSLVTFRVTHMNPGSGEWWLYGEDFRHFYGVPDEGAAYLIFPRASVSECAGFDPHNYRTWCPALLTVVK